MIQEQDIVVFQGRGDERLALGQSISHPDITMNTDYIKNSWKDYVKIDDKAYKIYKELEFGRELDYDKWTIVDGSFCIYSHNYDCGGYDINWIPLEWLELNISEIRNRYHIERDKGNSSLIGYC